MMSVNPPGEFGTTIVTGRDGQSAARDGRNVVAIASAAASRDSTTLKARCLTHCQTFTAMVPGSIRDARFPGTSRLESPDRRPEVLLARGRAHRARQIADLVP